MKNHRERVEQLTPEHTGRWLITTVGSAHVLDVDARTIARTPRRGELYRSMNFDGIYHRSWDLATEDFPPRLELLADPRTGLTPELMAQAEAFVHRYRDYQATKGVLERVADESGITGTCSPYGVRTRNGAYQS